MSFQTLMTAIPAAFSTGISPYFTLLVLGMGIRLEWIRSPSPFLEFMGQGWALGIVGGLYALEIALGIIPIPGAAQFIRILWNVIHEILVPLAGALVGVATSGITGEGTLTMAAISAGITIVPQTVKAAGQQAMEMVPVPGKILGFNLAKDALLAVFLGLFVYAWEHPWLMTFLVILSFVMMAALLWQLGAAIRWLWFNFRAIGARLTSLVSKRKMSDVLPSPHLALHKHQTPELVVAGMAQRGVPGGRGRGGYLSVQPEALVFTFRKWFGYRRWQIGAKQVSATYLHRQAMLDFMDIHYVDLKGRDRRARFTFLKNKETLVKQVGERFSARVSASGAVELGDHVAEGARKTAEATKAGAVQALQSGKQLAATTAANLAPKLEAGKKQATEKAAQLSQTAGEKWKGGQAAAKTAWKRLKDKSEERSNPNAGITITPENEEKIS